MNRGWWDIGRKQAGRVRKVAIDRLEVMQQCHSSTTARRMSRAHQSGAHVTNISRVYTNFCRFGLMRENSENLSHAKNT